MKKLKCYVYFQILYGLSAENFRFWLFCIDLVPTDKKKGQKKNVGLA